MKISVDWLKDFIELPEPPRKLKEDLTMLGLVVESITEEEGGPVLEVEVTSNRPDCLSHIGIARELAVLYSRPLIPRPPEDSLKADSERTPFEIEIADADLCPRYAALVLDEVRVSPSPPWMQRRLQQAGMRPLNNIVDITNYVLLELGHPLHAFDYENLVGRKILVSRAGPGEKLVTLDGIERQLDAEMLLIRDAQRPIAIAGVMGGFDSEIRNETGRVLLESAYFHPASIRRTSKKLGLSTEASIRFERGADWENPVRAIARACRLIQELAGGRLAGSLADVYPGRLQPTRIRLHRARAEAILGVRLENGFIAETLRRLQFDLEPVSDGVWEVSCPSHRADMELENDLVEEIARFYGYQNIPTTLPAGRSAGEQSPVFAPTETTRRLLLGLGYSEAVHLSFARESDHLSFPPAGGERIRIRNPLTEDTQFLRSSLAPGLVRTARRNFNHDRWNVRLFEIGKTYTRSAEGTFAERNTLGILGTGSFAEPNWRLVNGEYDYFHLRGVVCALLAGLRTAPPEIIPAEVGWLNSTNSSAVVVEGRRVGVLGSLHPRIVEEHKFRQEVFLAEIDFDELSNLAFQPIVYQPLPRYPAVERDLSIVLARDVSYGTIRSALRSLGIEELVSMELVDVYEGEKIPAGKLSLTMRFVFRDRSSTLTVDRVQGFSDNIVTFLRESFGAELR